MTAQPAPIRLAVSKAREELAAIVLRVQDPSQYCVLTRHGKPVAAVVSMANLERIWREEDFAKFADPKRRPYPAILGPDGQAARTEREAAEFVRAIQLKRWGERRVLARQGMSPLEGGELMAEVEEEVAPEVEVEVAAKRRWWRRAGRA